MRGEVQGEWLLVALVLPLSFTVGLLGGMAIPRGITAFVIAIMISASLAGPLLIFALGEIGLGFASTRLPLDWRASFVSFIAASGIWSLATGVLNIKSILKTVKIG